MGDRVSQDPEGLRRVVNYMGDKVERYRALCDEVTRLIDRRIGFESNGDRAWWGPNAGNFSKRVNNDLNRIFDGTRSKIDGLKDNLKRQADAWQHFEGQ